MNLIHSNFDTVFYAEFLTVSEPGTYSLRLDYRSDLTYMIDSFIIISATKYINCSLYFEFISI